MKSFRHFLRIFLVQWLILSATTLHANLPSPNEGNTQGSLQRMSADEAWRWYNRTPWYCGVNYIPANAINYTAMWDPVSFSPKVIDNELALMQDLGMNCVRVVLQYAVYADNPKKFLKTFDHFLAICQRHGISVMPIFFDDCTFGANLNPSTGLQPEPLEGWYAWAWSPSPGYEMVVDERTHPLLERYVKDVLRHHANDPRIMLWDLYNEPTNTSMPERTWPLLLKVFQWAREVNPSQPISSGIWNANEELTQFLADHSDVITYHCYGDRNVMQQTIDRLTSYGRPLVCTEWLNRPRHSTISDIMPMLRERRVGSMIWGLVNGKTQTHLPWGHRPEHGPYTGPWQHDIYRTDHTPYDAAEIALIRKLTSPTWTLATLSN